jgi:hypothetical protein
MHRFSPLALSLAISFSFASVACEGESHELGTEPDGGLNQDLGSDQPTNDSGVIIKDPNRECAPNGGESCSNGNEIVVCRDGQEETVARCDGQCLLIDRRQFTCEGGARPFTPTGVGLIVDGAVRASISTVSGAIGCGLADDYGHSPGLAGEQVYLTLANIGFGCPAGLYGLDASCDAEHPSSSSARCAIYRRWTSTRLEAAEALAGAVTISSAPSGACQFEVELVLGGQSQTVRFSADVSASTTHQSCPSPM